VHVCMCVCVCVCVGSKVNIIFGLLEEHSNKRNAQTVLTLLDSQLRLKMLRTFPKVTELVIREQRY
jgi:hypothetical protein